MDQRTLEEIGLGQSVQTMLYGISLLPFVGVVIGSNYAVRRNAATRQLGRRLVMWAIWVHLTYGCCICPAATYWALAQ